ncbi:myosin-binding protein 7-like isoform X2 [Andrographis paniculata]|uniref:myosin-binding protein 7-like isoform X2 n=1 Tax=Andrographis paniculata TaxID=175694 RepID=UPI0021E726F1|nr:myosin-binding protein 7-like isoform X2 [Andrographis paniculata]
METEYRPPPLLNIGKCCRCKNCLSSTMKKSFSAMCLSSSAVRVAVVEEEKQCSIPAAATGLAAQQKAHIDILNECAELRETISRQQHIIENLISELEKERNAASSAANEAMSMILRLQRDKAEIQMEARQFRTYTEEKLAHDQQEIIELLDLLNQKEEEIELLSSTTGGGGGGGRPYYNNNNANKHRMIISHGIMEDEEEDGQFREIFPSKEYDDQEGYNNCYYSPENHHIDKYDYNYSRQSSGNELISDLEFRISLLEKSPPCSRSRSRIIQPNSPARRSTGKEMWPDFTMDSPKLSLRKMRRGKVDDATTITTAISTDEADDLMIDRVCTVDSAVYTVNGLMDPTAAAAAAVMGNDDYCIGAGAGAAATAPRDIEIQKLYARVHALEADREIMRQSIASMGSNKAQMVLLKEIAQNWCREMSPAPPRQQQMTNVHVPKQPYPLHPNNKFSFISSILAWIVSIVFFWKRKPGRCKYQPFGTWGSSVGLLLLLERCPPATRCRLLCFTSQEVGEESSKGIPNTSKTD